MEIYAFGDCTCASTDFIDETLFRNILREDLEHYGSMDFLTFQGNVLSSMIRIGLITKEARPLAYYAILDLLIRKL
ncbi:hypothetical protein GCM10008956_29880 [Deinococcus arenae]|uniref:Uncharacterized protein n=1 Tax=Deinococcus arenae TaxID=1452751 RepID=A0A8H9GRA3_9DEIO|nr:hypothetical protein [Deinococcus arenae]GGM51866.1 hypothetical protein GCM10008956_29880 [Deinococcus arenae]